MNKIKIQLIINLFIVAACNNKDTRYEARLIRIVADSTSARSHQIPVATDGMVVKSSQEIAREVAACRQGTLKAETDRNSGVIGYYFGGIGIPSYADTLERKYKMVIRRQGCVMEDGWECYNRYMDSVIISVYHVNLITQEHNKALNALLAKRRH